MEFISTAFSRRFLAPRPPEPPLQFMRPEEARIGTTDNETQDTTSGASHQAMLRPSLRRMRSRTVVGAGHDRLSRPRPRRVGARGRFQRAGGAKRAGERFPRFGIGIAPLPA